jgi:O-antigen/teichoic acid export membrane protein
VLVSIGFFFSPFSAITQAVLVRNMQFGKILVIRLTTTLSFAIVAILLAFNGESYFSLGYATLVSSIINFALHLYYKDSSYSWLPSFTGLARQFHFGIYVSLSSISNRITYNIPDLIIGKVASMTDVGIFSRGFGFINFANAILTDGVKQVVLPHLSELRRGGKNYREAYLNIVSLYSGISVPCFAAINAMSYPVIITLFGDQWAAAAPISSILAIWGGVVSIHAFYGPLLINVGKEKLLMITDVGMLLIRIASIVLSSEYGLEAIAWSLMATGVVELFVKFIMVSVYVDIPVFQAVRNVAKSLCVALVLWSYLTFAGYYLDLNNVLPQVSFFILGFSGFIIWVGALFLCKHGLTIHIKSGVAKLI